MTIGRQTRLPRHATLSPLRWSIRGKGSILHGGGRWTLIATLTDDLVQRLSYYLSLIFRLHNPDAFICLIRFLNWIPWTSCLLNDRPKPHPETMKATLFLTALAACAGLSSAFGKYLRNVISCCLVLASIELAAACRQEIPIFLIRLTFQEPQTWCQMVDHHSHWLLIFLLLSPCRNP